MSTQKPMIIDCHGHYTTAPKALEAWRNAQIANLNTPELGPKVADLKISDDELRESIETNQLRLMKERGSDLTLFSPRAMKEVANKSPKKPSQLSALRAATTMSPG